MTDETPPLGPPTDLRALLPEAQRVADGELEVAFRALGDGPGPALVLVHGMGSSGPFWARSALRLAARRRVVLVDLPGHGESSKRPDHDYSFDLFHRALVAVASRLGLDRPVLVGHSMGAQVALAAALRDAPSPSRLVLVNPAGFEAFTEDEGRVLRGTASAEAYRSMTPAQLAAVMRLTFAEWNEDGLGLVALRRELLASDEGPEHARAVERCVHAMLDAPVVARLGEVSVPSLVLMGAEDRLIPNRALHPNLDPRSVAEAGARALGGAPVRIVDGTGHMVPAERPDLFADAVLEFLEDG